MFCQKCGAKIPEDSQICTQCGQQVQAITQSTIPQPVISQPSTSQPVVISPATKFCQHCGSTIDMECVICPKCGKQVGQLKQEQPQIIVNNSNVNSNVNQNTSAYGGPKPKNKWIAFLLCLFLGGFGAHKFYEGKILLGIVYLLTLGIFGIGWFVSLISLLFKPNPYYV